MLRWTSCPISLALLIACSAPHSPPASGLGGVVFPATPGPQASEPAQPPSVTLDGGPGAAQVGICSEGYHDSPQLLPTDFHLASPEQRVCDLKKRIIIVDDRNLTVLTRPALTQARAPIARREQSSRECGPDGGGAGCSISYRRFWSAALGSGHVEFGSNVGNLYQDDADGSQDESCREWKSYPAFATCSTATHFVMLELVNAVGAHSQCWQLQASVWSGPTDQHTELAGDIDRAASVGNRAVFRFAGSDPDRAIMLRFDGRARTATLEIGGLRESCVAFRI